MDRLLRGLAQFQRDVFPKQRHLFHQLASSQNPEFLFIACADSRVVPQLITQSAPGDLFICRNAGNMVPPYGEMSGGVTATIEYAVVALGVQHIIVCGHRDCGAMRAVMHPEKVSRMPNVASWLRHGELARHMVEENYNHLQGEERLRALTKENIVAQLDHLKTHPSVAARLASGKLELHGWLYHIESGEVEAYDAERGSFVRLEGVAPQGTLRRRSVMEVSA
jgi:carbonic anhydrase